MATFGFAAVASASPAGGAQQSTTSRPDVVSAVITDQPSVTNAVGTPKITVCFDQQIATPIAAKFTARGSDVAGTAAPILAVAIPAELNCASLTFAPLTNLAGFSTVEVETGAVSLPGGGAGTNPQGAAALTGGDVAPGAGKIAAPNLTNASVADVAGGTEVTYTFDKMITQAGILPARFGYYNTAGAAVAATSVVTVADRAVKVKFGTTVAATARVFVTNDAVTLASQPARGNAATATSGAGGIPPASSAPDLTGIARVASLQATYDLTYSQTIMAGTVGNCQADTPTGRYVGTVGAVQNANTVRVTFGGLAASSRSDEEIVRISDIGGCVAATASSLASSVGAAPVQNKDHTPGFTSGPDLSGCVATAGGTDVTYTFDELIAPVGAVSGAAFGLVDNNGDRTSGAGPVLQIVDNKVTVRFASVGVLSSAKACTVDRGALLDRAPGGEPNSLNTVKANSVGTAENAKPPVTTGPLPPTTTPPPIRAPFVKRAVRTISGTPSCHSVGGGKVRCTTKGTVRLSADLTPLGKKNICIGTVRVRFTSGKKALSTRTAAMSTACTYKSTVTFKASRKQRASLRVQARYNGSLVSKTKSSTSKRARVR